MDLTPLATLTIQPDSYIQFMFVAGQNDLQLDGCSATFALLPTKIPTGIGASCQSGWYY